MTTCNHYYYCKCFILLSITSIFSFMFIILLVATATLDGLPSYRTVLNCFHLLWFYKLYPLLGWLYRLPGWFYSFAFTFILICIIFHLFAFMFILICIIFHLFAFTFILICIIFHLYYYCLTVLPLPMLCPFPFYGIKATLFWLVIVVLCSLSLHLCLP